MGTHAGSRMEITKDRVVFTNAKGAELTGRITQFKTVHDNSETYYRLSYRGDDRNEYQLSLVFDPADGGTMKLRNQPELIWKRTGAST